jgi:hypothetical protein
MPQVLRCHDYPASLVIVWQVHSDGVPLYQIGYIFQNNQVPLVLGHFFYELKSAGETIIIGCLLVGRADEQELTYQGIEEHLKVKGTRNLDPDTVAELSANFSVVVRHVDML